MPALLASRPVFLPVAHAVRLVLLGCALAVGAAQAADPVPSATTPMAAQSYQVPAGPLGRALAEVAAASGYDPTGSCSVGSRYATNMPRHLFKQATSYQLPGALHRWKVGGSIHVQDSISSTWNVRQGGYALVGLHVAYALSRQMDLSLNVNNLFDRSHYSGIGADNGPNFFGDPRNVMLTARYRF